MTTPRTMYEVTASRLQRHIEYDKDLLEDQDRAAIEHVIHLLQCAQDARVLGTSISMAAFTRNLR